jgi:hypothetical protein
LIDVVVTPYPITAPKADGFVVAIPTLFGLPYHQLHKPLRLFAQEPGFFDAKTNCPESSGPICVVIIKFLIFAYLWLLHIQHQH